MRNDIVLTFGTFDLFHIGHLRILERASKLGKLIVGVSTDKMNLDKKGRYPVYNENDRRAIVKSIYCVHDVFFEESLLLKRKYIHEYGAKVLVMGDDWLGKFDEFKDICVVKYLKRTPMVSTSEVKIAIESSITLEQFNQSRS